MKPIAMKCSQEQFDDINPKIIDTRLVIADINNFKTHNYLTNNIGGSSGRISNTLELYKEKYWREVHETWDEKVFLEACGIELV